MASNQLVQPKCRCFALILCLFENWISYLIPAERFRRNRGLAQSRGQKKWSGRPMGSPTVILTSQNGHGRVNSGVSRPALGRFQSHNRYVLGVTDGRDPARSQEIGSVLGEPLTGQPARRGLPWRHTRKPTPLLHSTWFQGWLPMHNNTMHCFRPFSTLASHHTCPH